MISAFYAGDVGGAKQQDHTDGIKGVFNCVKNDSSWGWLAELAWGASRCMDYFEIDNDINHEKMAVIGHSRGGAASCITGLYDERFYLTISNCSGICGGAMFRHPGGYNIDNRNTAFPFWYSPNLKLFSTATTTDLPVDQHMLVACLAASKTHDRAVKLCVGIDETMQDPEADWHTALWSRPAFNMLGKKGIGTDEDLAKIPKAVTNRFYEMTGDPPSMGDSIPAPGTQVIGDGIAFHVHFGHHLLGKWDWEQNMIYFDYLLKKPVATKPDIRARYSIVKSSNAAAGFSVNAMLLNGRLIPGNTLRQGFSGCIIRRLGDEQTNNVVEIQIK
jgi:hypothetical protein